MLKKIPKNLPAEVVDVLMKMGHGDEIVIADGNFPSESLGQRNVSCIGQAIPELLASVLELLPLDTYSKDQVFLMSVVDGDDYQPVIWEEYKQVIAKSGEPGQIAYLERFAFYERAKKAFAVISTSEMSLYANIILKKGVVQ